MRAKTLPNDGQANYHLKAGQEAGRKWELLFPFSLVMLILFPLFRPTLETFENQIAATTACPKDLTVQSHVIRMGRNGTNYIDIIGIANSEKSETSPMNLVYES